MKLPIFYNAVYALTNYTLRAGKYTVKFQCCETLHLHLNFPDIFLPIFP